MFSFLCFDLLLDSITIWCMCLYISCSYSLTLIFTWAMSSLLKPLNAKSNCVFLIMGSKAHILAPIDQGLTSVVVSRCSVHFIFNVLNAYHIFFYFTSKFNFLIFLFIMTETNPSKIKKVSIFQIIFSNFIFT